MEIWREGVDYMHLAQDWDQWSALVNTVVNLLVPQKAGNVLTTCVTVSFSRRALLRVIS